MDNTALFPGCLGFSVSPDTVSIRVSDWDQAWKLNQSYLKTLAGLARFLGREQLEIVHETQGKPSIPILASMADERLLFPCEERYRQLVDVMSKCESVDHRGKVMKSLVNIEALIEFVGQKDYDAEIAQLAYSEKNFPVWIVDQISQEVLLANRVARALR